MASHFYEKTSFSCLLKLLLCFSALFGWNATTVRGERVLAGCPVSRLHIVSYNETLLPRLPDNILPQIQFSSGPLVGTSFINYGPNHTDVWCAPEIETVPEPFVNLLFTEPVVVVGIISGGYTYQTGDILDGMKEYVSSFTLQHAQSEDDNFTLYNADLTGSGETEFIIDDSTVDQLVILREPFSALRVRLQVIERTRTPLINITCWSMAFLGCAASEALYEELDPVQVTDSPTPTDCPTINTSPSVETVVITTTVTATPPSDCSAAAAGQSGPAAVSVAIPVALVTIVTVVIVVVLGVLICVKKGHRKLTSDVGESPGSAPPLNVHYINTGTQGGSFEERRNSNSRERAITVKEVENELYLLNENRRDDDVYEAIPGAGAQDTSYGNRYSNTIDVMSPGRVSVGVAPTQDPPPYSLLTMASSPPLQSPTQQFKAAAPTDDETYSTVGEDVYSEPVSPVKGHVAAAVTGENSAPFQLSRNESYGSLLPNLQRPHYATPTSTLRYIPEAGASNSQSQEEEDEYEPIVPRLLHGRNH